MTQKYKINIIGAGLGGLTAAILLKIDGHDVKVFEQAPELGEVGAGIQVSANAVKVLWKIGLANVIDRQGVKPTSYKFRLYNSGELLQEFPLASTHEEKCGAPYYQMHRADLHKALTDKVLEIDPNMVELNKTATKISQNEAGINISFMDGSVSEADLVIGADGIKSIVRQETIGRSEADFTGETAWRLIVPTEKLPKGLIDEAMNVWVGPGKHAVVYYLRGGELVNFVGCVTDPNWTDDSWTIKGDWNDLRADYEGWNDEILAIIDATDKNECFKWALYNRRPVDNWSTDRSTLLGDSCHATLPYMAQGAAMAIEDGAVLNRALASEEKLADALDLYQRNRIDRTAKIVNESSDNARLFHLPSEEELRAAFAKRKIGDERNNWLYNYDPINVALI